MINKNSHDGENNQNKNIKDCNLLINKLTNIWDII